MKSFKRTTISEYSSVCMTASMRETSGSIVVEVRQTIRDLQGRPLQDQTDGLRDKTVGHFFHLQEGKVTRFDIRDAS